MTNTPHATRCARRVAREARAAGGSEYDAAVAVHRHCGLSLLRAHRIAHGYTLVEAVDALKEVLASRGTPSSGLRHQRLSQWEHGQDTPSPHYLDALCFLYRTRPDRLGFGHDYSDPDPVPQNGIQNIMDRRNFVSLAAAGAMFMTAPPGNWLFGEDFDPPGGRRATAGYVELLEELTERNAGLLYTQPAEYIPARMVDLARVEACLLTATSQDVQRRLHRVYAKNAGFIAVRLYDIADASDAFEWFGIARRAARLAEDATVRAWVAGRTADACACYRQFKSGLVAAQAAQSAGARRANPAAVMGYLAEAGVQARLNRRPETLEAVRRADRMFAELGGSTSGAEGFIVSEYLLRWHQSNALAHVGAHAEAARLRARALELPPARSDRVGQALLGLDEAAARIETGEVEWGCHTVATVWRRVPDEFRVGLVPDRAMRILDSVDSGHALTGRAAELRELLESAAGEAVT